MTADSRDQVRPTEGAAKSAPVRWVFESRADRGVLVSMDGPRNRQDTMKTDHAKHDNAKES